MCQYRSGLQVLLFLLSMLCIVLSVLLLTIPPYARRRRMQTHTALILRYIHANLDEMPAHHLP
jgi:hypothetical protein